MSSFVKAYPRAKVTRHKTLDGWVIDLYLRATAKPMRINATYATIAWAHKAANHKLGVKPGTAPAAASEPASAAQQPEAAVQAARAPQAGRSPNGTRATGTCNTCHRPMRPAGTKASDHPGTTLRQREGLCQSCNNKKAK